MSHMRSILVKHPLVFETSPGHELFLVVLHLAICQGKCMCYRPWLENVFLCTVTRNVSKFVHKIA